MAVFCVFFVAVVGLMCVEILLVGLGGHVGGEVCYVAGDKGF